jgi:nucleotide-binding universal stress UspA family protein
MVHVSKILIPIDFSERCLGAARFAIPLAERFHSEITFLHVEPPPEYDSEENAEREARVEKQLRDFLCAAFAHLDVKRVLRVGPDVGSEIVQSACEQQSDLIMMPTHGYGVFRRGKNSAVVFAGGRRTRSGPQSARAHSLTTGLWGSALGTPGYRIIGAGLGIPNVRGGPAADESR